MGSIGAHVRSLCTPGASLGVPGGSFGVPLGSFGAPLRVPWCPLGSLGEPLGSFSWPGTRTVREFVHAARNNTICVFPVKNKGWRARIQFLRSKIQVVRFESNSLDSVSRSSGFGKCMYFQGLASNIEESRFESNSLDSESEFWIQGMHEFPMFLQKRTLAS